MPIKYIPPKTDFMFKKIFGDPNNIEILTAFLKSTLDIEHDEYEKINLIDTHLPQEDRYDKLGILDVKVQTKSGSQIDIEIQLSNIPHMRERIVLYLSRMVSSQIGSGQKYNSIKRSIIIVITDYEIIKGNDKYHNVYTLRDKESKEFTNLLEINTLELPKLSIEDDKSDLWNWMKFLKSKNEEELKMVEAKSELLKKAVVIVKKLSADEKMTLLYEQQEKVRMDDEDRIEGTFNSGLDKGKIEGLKEGELKGKIEEKIESIIMLVPKYNFKIKLAMADVGLGNEYKKQIVSGLKKLNTNFEE